MDDVLNKVFNESIDLFLSHEIENILDDVNERNLCGRLVLFLNDKCKENGLQGYYVDPEYNRMQNGQVKTILDGNLKVIKINCDIIIHSRGHNIQKDNLIAIEMKKSNSPKIDKDNDRERLRALTKDSYDDIWSYDSKVLPEHVCGYSFGFYIELNIRNRRCLIEKYVKGKINAEWTLKF